MLVVNDIIRWDLVIIVGHRTALEQIDSETTPDAVADLRISNASEGFNRAINPARLVMVIVNPRGSSRIASDRHNVADQVQIAGKLRKLCDGHETLPTTPNLLLVKIVKLTLDEVINGVYVS